MSKFSNFRYTPYTNSTNSQFNPTLYNNKGAITGCVGAKNMRGGETLKTSTYYGLKAVDDNTASLLRGSYAPVLIQSHSQCAGGKKRKSRKMKRNTKYKKHYMWNTKGKRYTAKTYKQHLRGVKLGHTHKKPKKSRKMNKRSRKAGTFGLRKKHRSVTYGKVTKPYTSQGSVPKTMVKYGGSFGLRKKHRSVTYGKVTKPYTSQGSVPKTMVKYGGKKRKSKKSKRKSRKMKKRSVKKGGGWPWSKKKQPSSSLSEEDLKLSDKIFEQQMKKKQNNLSYGDINHDQQRQNLIDQYGEEEGNLAFEEMMKQN